MPSEVVMLESKDGLTKKFPLSASSVKLDYAGQIDLSTITTDYTVPADGVVVTDSGEVTVNKGNIVRNTSSSFCVFIPYRHSIVLPDETTAEDIIAKDSTGANSNIQNVLDGKADSGFPKASNYQAVTYLESHKEEYINTHITANSKTRFEVVGSFNNASPAEEEIMGATNVPQGYESRCAFGLNATNGWYFGTGSINTFITSIPRDTNKHTFVVDVLNSKIKLDNYEQSVSFTFASDEHGEIFLFARNGGWYISTYASFKMESAKIYTDNVLVFDGVPCYRKSDNVAGIYDRVTKTFFTNEGSGTFSVGTDSDVPIIDTPSLKDVVDSIDSLFKTVQIQSASVSIESKSDGISDVTFNIPNGYSYIGFFPTYNKVSQHLFNSIANTIISETQVTLRIAIFNNYTSSQEAYVIGKALFIKKSFVV